MRSLRCFSIRTRLIFGRLRPLACVAVAASLLTAIPGWATTIDLAENGSFEADPIPANSFGTQEAVVTGWDLVTFLANGEPDPIWPDGGSTGPQWGDCGNNPLQFCLQSFIVGAGFELLTIDWQANNAEGVGLNPTPYTVQVKDSGGSVVATGDYAAFADNTVWDIGQLSLSGLELGPGDYSLLIFGTAGETSNDVLIDDVQILATIVPEPATGGLLLLGLAGLGVVRRRRA